MVAAASVSAMTLTIDNARTILSAAFAKRIDAGINPLAIIVLDAGGHLVAFEREDGVPYGRFEVAHGKAAGALAVGVNSRTLEVLAKDRPHFMTGVVGALNGAVVPVAGGVIVLDAEGNRIGAVGASGDTSDNDEIAVIAGIVAAGLVPSPK